MTRIVKFVGTAREHRCHSGRRLGGYLLSNEDRVAMRGDEILQMDGGGGCKENVLKAIALDT